LSIASRPRSTKHPRARRSLVPPAIVLLVPILLGSSATRPIRPNPALPLGNQADRNALLYAEAAEAARRDDCAGAARSLAPLASGKGAEAEFARLVGGFHAYACKQAGPAEERLFAAQDPDGPLEDWRLYVLSDASRTRNHVLLAQASLAKLLGDYPDSPLRPKAFAAAAQLAWEQGDSARALELIERARREKVGIAGTVEATRLEALAWEIGTKLGNDLVRAEAARRLLSDSPAKAAELRVAEMFREADGTLQWAAILSPDQLKQRARSLLDLKLDANAVESLDAAGGRDLEWALLKAEALTRLQKGTDALALLAGLTASTPQETARLEWARAQAAGEASRARRGRTTPTADRRRYLEESHLHLRNVAKLAPAGSVGDTELSTKALRTLYADLADDDRFDESIEVLRQLRKISPADTTGAEHLWKRGWSEYVRSNPSGAVGYWTELFALYPEDSSGRRGRYWTGRAFEALGETERAQQIYREVAAADTTDFYRKNALTRLRGQAPAKDERGLEPWPEDPVLQRARLLTDLGLEDLALSELEALSAGRDKPADARAVQALQALIESRQGARRKSVLTIRKAFPALGTPYQATLPEEARRLYYPLEFQDTIRTWAVRNRLPLHLVLGIIRQESAFDTQAQSWAGARGLMQLMPATARELAGKAGLDYTHEKLSDPAFNVRLGTTYFSQVMDMFDHNVELSLAGYNGGPYRIKRLWKESGSHEIDRFLESLDIEESKTYVKRILVLSDSYRQLYPMPG
jgi:soluble lytic murein transglycosylase-like protein